MTNLESLKGWKKLSPQVQKAAIHATQAVIEALQNESESRMEAGRSLVELRNAIPRGMFLACLREVFRMSRATGYRYIDQYTAASKKLPKPVLEVVMRRAYRPAQIKRIEENPPPRTVKDPIQIGQYLDRLERTPVEVRPEATVDADVLLKECVNFVTSRYLKLPQNTRTRAAWVRCLVGMLMTKFGMGSEQRFEPMAVPEKFKVVRGRPKVA